MNKKAIRDCMRSMLRHCVLETGPQRNRYAEPHLGLETPADGIRRILIGDGLKAFTDCLHDLSSDPVIGEKVSCRRVERSIWALLLAFESDPDVGDAELDEAISREIAVLRSTPERWVIQMPIENLFFDGFDELVIGKVTFCAVPAMRERTVREWDSRLPASEHTAELREARDKNLGEEFDRLHEHVTVGAETVLEAEHGRAVELAESEVDASLNLLRCYTHLLFSRAYSVRIGLTGEFIYSPRGVLSFREVEQELSISYNSRAVGSLCGYRLDVSKLEHLRRHCSFDELSGVLAKRDPERTPLEKAVATAVRWLGRGISSPDVPQKVLNFAVASERLLLSDSDPKSEIIERYARRMAFLVGEEPEQRRRISERARELYRMRSATVHAGRVDPAEHDVNEMEWYVVSALVNIAGRLHQWKTHQNLIDWVEDQIFGV